MCGKMVASKKTKAAMLRLNQQMAQSRNRDYAPRWAPKMKGGGAYALSQNTNYLLQQCGKEMRMDRVSQKDWGSKARHRGMCSDLNRLCADRNEMQRQRLLARLLIRRQQNSHAKQKKNNTVRSADQCQT